MAYWSSSLSSSTRSFKCVCFVATVAAVLGLMTILLAGDLAILSGAAVASRRLILEGLPNSANNEIAFTDPQYHETVEEQYNKIISSQKWLRQRVDWEERNLQKAPEITSGSQQEELTVTIFSAPPAFTGCESDLNRQALLSWLHLSPRPQVVLLGNHSSLHRVAAEFPGLVTVEPNIDYSFTGIPLFHSMVARANAATTNVTALVPPTVMLLQDFMPGLRKLAATFQSQWALAAQRLEISNLPFRFVHKGGAIVFLEHSLTGESMIDREMASFVRSSGRISLLEGVNVWAWTVTPDAAPLFAAPMPPFTSGAGYHDQWMARALAQAGSRIVVDATDALVGFHVGEPQTQGAAPDAVVPAYVAAAPAVNSTKPDTHNTTTMFWNVTAIEWHNIANLYLYRTHRDIMAEEKALLSGAGWKLIGCPEPSMIKLCISETHSAANPCRCESTSARPVSGTRYAETILEKEARLRLEVIRVPALEPEGSHTLAHLLPSLAPNKTVVLVGATSADQEILWSFMCRATALNVRNVLIAAFDKDLYEAALVRGLPVFHASSKADVVVKVLQRGYNVLWSDPDVVWFQNPLPRVTQTEPGSLAVASDEPDARRPGSARVNFGFFYARPNPATVHTFGDLAGEPEQRFFGRMQCERGRVCALPNGLRVSFLNRRAFANGLVHEYWAHQNLTEAAASNGLFVLHNNWIDGTELKVRRQKAKRVWFFNDTAGMCVHPWQQQQQQQQQQPPPQVPRQ